MTCESDESKTGQTAVVSVFDSVDADKLLRRTKFMLSATLEGSFAQLCYHIPAFILERHR